MTASGRGLAALLLGGSTLAAAEEYRDFDPARHREDLVLIQPLFTPPELLPGPVTAPGALPTGGALAWRARTPSP